MGVVVGDPVGVWFRSWLSRAAAEPIALEVGERKMIVVDPRRIDLRARARRLSRDYGLPKARIEAGFRLVGATGFEPATFRPPADMRWA